MFVVHVPYVFMAAWKMVYPFIDEKTKKKVSFVFRDGKFDLCVMFYPSLVKWVERTVQRKRGKKVKSYQKLYFNCIEK